MCFCFHVHMLHELTEAKKEAAVCRIAMVACDVLVDCGFTKPIAQLTVQDIPSW